MAAALVVVAFLCVVVLVFLLPAYWTSRNIAMLALIWWLVLCNVIQGINAVVWAGNVDVRIPVWCDIGTKLLLGVRLAVPAACLCLSNRVRHLLTTGDAKGGIGILSFDLTMCIIGPIIYMALHIIVQDHRFDLTENFGCSPAVYNTVPALFLIWLPPLILSMSAIMLTCITTYCGHRRGFTLVHSNGSASSGRHTFDFLRPLLRSLLVALLSLASSAFSLHAALASTPHLLPWTSWNAVHAQLSKVDIISDPADPTRMDIEVAWWTISVSSFLLIGVFLVNVAHASREDNSLEGYRAMVLRASILFTSKDEVRPLSSSSSVMDLRSHMSSKRSSETLMSIHPMASEGKGSARSRSRLRAAPLSIPLPDGKTASPPNSIVSDDTDISFAHSAMSYLDSPVGRATIASMPRPPSIFRPSNIPGHLPDAPPPATAIDPMEPRSLTQNEAWRSSSRRRPGSIVAGPWPRPPSSIPTSPVNSGSFSSVSSFRPVVIPSAFSEQVMSIPMPSHVAHCLRPPSNTSVNTSPAPSTISNSAYVPEPPPLHDSPTLPHFPPFADASIPAEQGHTLDPGQGAGLPKQTRRTRSRDGLPILTRNMSLSGLRGRENRPEGFDGGAIYMTVVQETA